jgi:hypothetical protein
MRGRPFGFLGGLCAMWVGARVAMVTYAAPVDFVQPMASNPEKGAEKSEPRAGSSHASEVNTVHYCCHPENASNRTILSIPMAGSAPQFADDGQVLPIFPDMSYLLPAVQNAPQTSESPSPLIPFSSIGPSAAARNGSISAYAYSFWRNGPAPLGFAQYGGGQSGIIATYKLDARASLLARTTIGHTDIRNREAAVGIRWSPKADIPFSITVERRFRNNGSDASAAYIASGQSAIKLPLGFALDTFGQAGVITGKETQYFFDGQARAERALLSSGPLQVRVGGGIWTGGQKGIARVDIGPTVGTEIVVQDIRIRVNADWRFRIAGDARPGSGPALTLSTSF